MPSGEFYGALRAEIAMHDVLLHVITVVVVIIIVLGAGFVEKGDTIVSIFLPLISVAWASAVLRLDFFIHRQGAYLRILETQLLAGTSSQGWETWKAAVPPTRYLVPIADVIGIAAIVAPTVYILFGPARVYFLTHGWRGDLFYAIAVLAALLGQLACLPVIPIIFR